MTVKSGGTKDADLCHVGVGWHGVVGVIVVQCFMVGLRKFRVVLEDVVDEETFLVSLLLRSTVFSRPPDSRAGV